MSYNINPHPQPSFYVIQDVYSYALSYIVVTPFLEIYSYYHVLYYYVALEAHSKKVYLQFPEDVENYQPISILPIVAKMFEKEVQHQVYAFLTKHELLHPCQHGFCARRSTHTALLTVVDKWLQSMDNGQVSPVVFLDLAFDTVRHPLLFKKLPTLKMCSTEVDWFPHIKPIVKKGLSAMVPCPWISLALVVSPKDLSWVLYCFLCVNTLPECIKYGDINMFADDTALFFTSKDHSEIEQKLNVDLKLISA